MMEIKKEKDIIPENSILILPQDTLVTIFTFLHGGMILRCGAVCKAWKSASEIDWLWLIKMGDELDDIPSYPKEKNIELNKKVAKQWRDQAQKSLKEIYVEKRRKEGVHQNLRVFPLTPFRYVNPDDPKKKPPVKQIKRI